MIDIHNHILVDIDDGPKTIEKSIALLKQAKDEGVTSIVATPHHCIRDMIIHFNKCL